MYTHTYHIYIYIYTYTYIYIYISTIPSPADTHRTKSGRVGPAAAKDKTMVSNT